MIYLDNAATTFPKPKSVKKAVLDAISTCGNPGRSAHTLSLRASELVYNARCEIADFLGVKDPEKIIFTPNATFGLNLAIKCRAKQGDHFLLSEQEHNAVIRPLEKLKRDGIIDYAVFSLDGDVMENVRAKQTDKTAVLICNPVSNVTGRRLPIDRIVNYAKKMGWYVILDGSQWIGHGEPEFDVIDKVDALAVPGHKGLYGIMGSGFLYLSDSDGLSSFLDGGSGTNSAEPFMPKELPERYEAGTLSVPAIASLAEGIRFIKSYGLKAITEKEKELSTFFIEGLKNLPGVNLIGEEKPEGSVVSFTVNGMAPTDVERKLDGMGFCVRSGLHCAPLIHRRLGTFPSGTVRVSTGLFNRKSDLDRLLKVLNNLKSGL